MKVLFIGERIQNIGGFEENELQKAIRNNIENKLTELLPQKPVVLTGLNIGIETWAADIANNLGVPYHVYIPFDNPHSKWPKGTQMRYLYLLKQASKKHVLDTGGFEVKKMHAKEVAMINDADLICTIFKQPAPIMKFIERANKTVVDLLPGLEQDDDSIPF